MEAIDILKKYDLPDEKIVKVPVSRWKEFPFLLKEFGLFKGVEIGVYKGNFTETLAKAGLEVTGVDAWKVYRDYKDYEENDLETKAYKEAKGRAEKHGFKLIKAWSMDAVKVFEDESLDFVFIDGNHDFEHVVEDVAAWSRKVRKGGIVSGHDFFRNHHKRFGVKEAIPAWCEAYQIRPLFIIDKDQCRSWFYVKS